MHVEKRGHSIYFVQAQEIWSRVPYYKVMFLHICFFFTVEQIAML